MTKRELLQLLDEIGVRPSRRLGQNFLTDPNLLEAMVKTASPKPDEMILEVGPGTGVMTRKLLAAGSRVTAVELDHRLCAYLRRAFAEQPLFRLVEADVCKTDLSELTKGEPFRVIANLPYACSSVFLANVARLQRPPSELFVLLQKEMADRLSAGCGTKDYGALSVVIQLVFEVEQLRKIPPEVFTPPPEVGSSFVRLVRRSELSSPAQRDAVHTLARIGFGQRRKKFARLLAGQFDASAVRHAFQSLGLAENVRAEALNVSAFVRLAACLAKQ